MIKHVSIKILGLVQGVFFRASVKEKAEEFNLAGFVRNDPDGSVYAEAEGEEENLEKLVAWCRPGPPAARVDKVDLNFSTTIKNFIGFEIR